MWHRRSAAGKLALVCHEYLKKGRQVFVEGRLCYAEWESNSDGRKQHRTEVVAAREERRRTTREQNYLQQPP